MARKRDETALHAALLDEEHVAAYLRAHPDFLVRHTDLLLTLSPPSRWSEDDGILDMQVFMIDRQRDELDRIRGAAEHLIHTSRSNMSTQTRTHKAVLSILVAEGMAQLVQAIGEDLPALLDVDIATLCFEPPARAVEELAVPGIVTLPGGMVAKLMGGLDRDCALTEEMPGDPMLFADAATLVQSSAVVRLTAGGRSPEGVMALGSRHGRTFHSGQGTELITFLARVVEGCVRRWVG
jgi:uncharacterized protein YigA (DUF484 family)